jgi:hypothetical protein
MAGVLPPAAQKPQRPLRSMTAFNRRALGRQAVAVLIEDKIHAPLGKVRFFVKPAFFLLCFAFGGTNRHDFLFAVADFRTLHGCTSRKPVDKPSFIAISDRKSKPGMASFTGFCRKRAIRRFPGRFLKTQ